MPDLGTPDSGGEPTPAEIAAAEIAAAEIAAVLLVDRAGAILLQLRDGQAPSHPHKWCVPGGHCEPGETPEQAATRELWEETALRADDGLWLFSRRSLPDGRACSYYYGTTPARQNDVVLGEGAAMVFLSPTQIHDGRPLTPDTAATLAEFLASPQYAVLSPDRPA